MQNHLCDQQSFRYVAKLSNSASHAGMEKAGAACPWKEKAYLSTANWKIANWNGIKLKARKENIFELQTRTREAPVGNSVQWCESPKHYLGLHQTPRICKSCCLLLLLFLLHRWKYRPTHPNLTTSTQYDTKKGDIHKQWWLPIQTNILTLTGADSTQWVLLTE